MFAGFFDGADGGLQIAQVVQGIKHAEHIDAVFGGFGNKGLYHVICIMAVTQQVLAAQQHLQPRIGQRFAQLPQALPRIFFQEAHTGIKGGTAPYFQRPIPYLVQFGTNRQHILGAHARRD